LWQLIGVNAKIDLNVVLSAIVAAGQTAAPRGISSGLGRRSLNATGTTKR
jgi:hypothetical protein